MKKNTLVASLNATQLDLRQKGINMVDLMMWIVIAAILLAAAIQGVGYYRESVILYHLKNDAIGAAANVKSSAAQDEGFISQPIVDTGLINTKWSDGTTHMGKANDKRSYSITAGNPEISKSVVYCSLGGITVVPNADLATFACGGTIVASPPIGGGTGGDGDDDGDDGGGTVTPPDKFMLAGWGFMDKYQLGNGPWQENINRGPFYQKTVTNIAVAMNTKACALADGVLYCWTAGIQNNVTNMQLSGVLLGKTVTKVSANFSNICVVASGKAYCWGSNSNGQLGKGTTGGTATTVPAEVSGGDLAGKTIVDISVAPYHTCAIDDAGKLYCWGKNQFGQIGIGTQVNALLPKAVSGALAGRVVKEVSTSSEGTCALDTAGLVYCWGMAGVTGTVQTGTNSPGPSMDFEWVPVRVANNGIIAGKTYTTVGVVRNGACAVSEGVQYCWGLIENGSVTKPMNTPRMVMNGLPAGESVIETDDYCVRMSGGGAYCNYYTYSATGYIRMGGTEVAPLSDSPVQEIDVDSCIISQGQPWCHTGVGIGSQRVVSFDYYTPDKIAESPVDISAGGLLEGKNVTLASGRAGHSCAVADDEMYCFGLNHSGQLGDGIIATEAKRPVKVVGLPAGAVKGIVTGDGATCALVEAQVYCWGYGNNGFLGNGSWGNSVSPVKVDGLSGKTINSITSGEDFVCATDTNKVVYCWGGNDDGQLGIGTTDSSNVPVVVSALAGKNVTEVTAGGYGVCAVVDGVPNCWGNNWSKQLDGSTWDSVLTPRALPMIGGLAGKQAVSIAVSDTSYCALASDKNVYCWGANDSGEFGDGSMDTISYSPQLVSLSGDTTKIVAGDYHICSLSGGSVYCWGTSAQGQIGAGVVNDSRYIPLPIVTSDALSGKTVTGLFMGAKGGFVTYK
jgi:alpha-tubulin suppressor-like RCC1 family protein